MNSSEKEEIIPYTLIAGAQRSGAVPRHREINEILVKKICKDLEIPPP